MRINAKRFRACFDALTRDGATPQGGLDRPALSEKHLEARCTFRRMIAQNGLEARVDGAGNLSALWRRPRPEAPTLMLGSHLDSVPNGGRFDGTLGVAAAFETLLTLREKSAPLDVHLEIMDFTDEEGTWVSLLGSRALTGQVTERDLRTPRGRPEAFEAALSRAGLSREGILGASRASEEFAAYLELHIEQGARLEDSQTDVGVVTGMVGIHMFLVTFHGRANHAGTTPMPARRDAAQGAAAFCLAVRRAVLERFPDCVANVGKMTFAPGAFNIVADRVTAYMELRSEDNAQACSLEEALRAEASRAAEEFSLSVDFEFLESVLPRKMDEKICRTLEAGAERLGLTSRRLPSLAGHDAQSMALLCPSGLVFAPSIAGCSHSPRENTAWTDCVHGANMLLQAAFDLGKSPGAGD